MTADEGGSATGEEAQFERRLRSLLDESADRLDGRVRSRLTRARYAALEARRVRTRAAWSRWAPAGALAATLLIAVGLFFNRDLAPPARTPAVSVAAATSEAAAAPSVDDLELLADNDAIELPNADDYDFYEWAAAQAKAGGEEIGS